MMRERIPKLFQRALIGAAMFLLLLLLMRFSVAWFYHLRGMQTFAKLESPITLDIRDGNKQSITHLDLSDIDLSEDTKTFYYAFCVASNSTDEYQLELAYTTNIGFEYTLYPASTTEKQDLSHDFVYSYTNGSEATATMYWNETTPLAGELIQVDSTTGQDHTNTYNTYENVQSHAEPLYWLSESVTPSNNDTENAEFNFFDFYILKLTWSNDGVELMNSKETDLVYLMAENVVS